MIQAATVFRETLTPEEVREQFEALAAEWKERAKYLSNTVQMAMLWPYQRIIGLGRPAVPLILESLQKDPAHWFWALQAITGEDPVLPDANGDVRRMVEAWLEWGRQRKLI
jgi:hypothetical protein